MFNSYKTKDLEDEAIKKTEKILNMILKEIEEIKSNKELGVVITSSISTKINEAYLIKSLRRKKFKVFKEEDDGCGNYVLKIIWGEKWKK